MARPVPAWMPIRHRHLQLGWLSLFVFATGGVVLEALHAFKVGAYLDVGNDTRRLLWTLAHAHGTLIGLLHLAFAVTQRHVHLSLATVTSRTLTAATVLLPGGFFLGGFNIRGGDPGLGVLLVPPGALVLLIALGAMAIGMMRATRPELRSASPDDDDDSAVSPSAPAPPPVAPAP
jgi:hypothetical protein